MTKSFASALVAGALLTSAPALASTIETFDTLPGMGNSPGAGVPSASQLSLQYLSDGVAFSSGAGYVAVVNHEPGDPSAEPSPPNIIGGTNADGTLNYNSPITAAFWFSGDFSQPGVTDSVQVLGDLIPIAGTATLEAFDIHGALIASDTEQDQEAGGLSLNVSGAGIHSISLTETSGTIGFDNFTFGPVTLASVQSAAPEPASWGLLVVGVLLGGVGLRRRRQCETRSLAA